MSAPGRRPGTRLGPYEISERIGTGGMGEVYRARDPRLHRDVALKLLPEDLAVDRNRIKRFQQEARTVSTLSHPNIVTVFEIGETDSVSYIAMELVEGQTLRQMLRPGGLAFRRILDLSVQIADGLSRAHEAGIVHRDLKPENVMVTTDGIVKILDFGLAKLTRSPLERGAGPDDGTLPLPTQPGVLLGTVRYMSPEQASGSTADFRADQFSFGSVLYEMATGLPPFQKATTVDTLSAILHDEPEPLSQLNPKIPAPLRWIIERCIAKDPKDRYAATRDLARDLQGLRQHLSEVSSPSLERELGRPLRRPSQVGGLLGLIFLLLAGGVALVKLTATRPLPVFRQLTFHGANIPAARLSPDGHTVVYAAQWDGKPLQLFTVRTESPESRSLEIPRADILSLSVTGEMALRIGRGPGPALLPPHSFVTDRDPRLLYGTLARVPLGGGEPREIVDDVRDADWAADGQSLAAVRFVDGKDQLEYPLGTVLERSNRWLNHPRVSPDGRSVAYLRISALALADAAGHVRDMGVSADEIAWSHRAGEIVISSVESGSTVIRAVSTGGRTREIATLPGDFVLQDVGQDGRLLLGRVFESSEILASVLGESRERNLSWFERSSVVDVSEDGSQLLFSEASTGTRGGRPRIFVRRIDGSPAKRLDDGFGLSISRDGSRVLALSADGNGLFLVPTGSGKASPIPLGAVEPRARGGFFPDGRRIFFMGMEEGHGVRAYVLDLDGGTPLPISPEGTRRGLLSGDGRFVAARDAKGDWLLYPTGTGQPQYVAGLLAGEEPIQWSFDGRFLYVRGADEIAPDGFIETRVFRVDPWSGRRELWKSIPPVNPLAGGGVGIVLFASEGRTCVFTHHRYSSDLFLAEGLR